MTWEQISYFFRACLSVSAVRIDEMTFAFARTQCSDRELKQKMEAQLEKIRNTSLVSLVRETL